MRALALCLLFALPLSASGADTIYKCIKGDRVVYSQSVCPTEYNQRELEFELGLTREVDSDRLKDPDDPLMALMSGKTISTEKLLLLIDGEIYRLKQENSYIEILRTSEKQKLDRKRFWRGAPENDPEYLKDVDEMNQRFNEMKTNNEGTITMLKERRQQVADAEKETAKP